MSKWEEICKNNNIDIPFLDLGHGKILYMLTEYLVWNWNFHPFLFFHCQRGDMSKVGHLCTPFLTISIAVMLQKVRIIGTKTEQLNL